MHIVTKTAEASLRHLMHMLDTHKMVYYTRYADGEFFGMLGRESLEHGAIPALAEELREGLRLSHPQWLIGNMVNQPWEPGMMYGLFAPFDTMPMIRDYLVNELLHDRNPAETITYENAMVFHYLAVFNQPLFRQFLDTYIRPKKKLFIGSTPRQQVERLFGPITHYVTIPRKNAYEQIDAWYGEALKYMDDVEVVLPTAGMATNAINKRLFLDGVPVHSIDIGSMVDAISGRGSRKWIKLKGHVVERLALDYRATPAKQLAFWRKEAYFALRKALKQAQGKAKWG